MKEYKPNLPNALKSGNKRDIILALKSCKEQNGAIAYPVLFSIKSEERLPELAKNNYEETLGILVAGLTLSFESMNLNRPMNNGQIIDLAETILESSSEDNLALEDVMLFLQKLVRGEYGKLYESMDIPKFMEKFEIYREERFQAMRTLREEQSIQHKTLPINDRLLTLRDFLTINKKHEQ